MVFRAVHRGEKGGKRVAVSTFGKREVKNFQLRATLSLPVKISSHVSSAFFSSPLLSFFFLLYISLLSRIIFFSPWRERRKNGGMNKKSEFSLSLSLPLPLRRSWKSHPVSLPLTLKPENEQLRLVAADIYHSRLQRQRLVSLPLDIMAVNVDVMALSGHCSTRKGEVDG